jgi:hypothetical protein
MVDALVPGSAPVPTNINMVEMKEGEIEEDELDNDEFKVDERVLGFEGDITCLVREMSKVGITPIRGGRI